MKAWFEYYHGYEDPDSNTKLGIGWYEHYRKHKWKGLTIQFYFYFGLLQFTIVDNYLEYCKRMRRGK